MFAALLIGLIAPSLFALIGREVGARKQAFSGRGWPIFAITVIVIIWGWRWIEHDDAMRLASTASYGPTAMGAEVLRVTASPYPGNPYRWHTVAETPAFYQMAAVDTYKDSVVTNPEQDLFYKPGATAATRTAKNSRLGRVYVDWSSWPLISDIGPSTPQDALPGATGWTEVSFVDLRFLYDTMMMQGRTNPPISGSVYVDSAGQVEWTTFGGRAQR
jgi:inner membrane protein